MKTARGFLLAGLVLMSNCLLVQAGEKKENFKEKIVGKWAPAEAKMKGLTLEFTKDGKVKFSVDTEQLKFSIDGTYKFLDDKTIELSMKNPMNPDDIKTDKVTVKSISAEEMEIENSMKKLEKLKRVK